MQSLQPAGDTFWRDPQPIATIVRLIEQSCASWGDKTGVVLRHHTGSDQRVRIQHRGPDWMLTEVAGTWARRGIHTVLQSCAYPTRLEALKAAIESGYILFVELDESF